MFTSKPDTMTVGDLVDDSKVTVTWTPKPEEYRSHLLCYFAVDENSKVQTMKSSSPDCSLITFLKACRVL